MSGNDTPQPTDRISAPTPRSIRADRRAKLQLDIRIRQRELAVQLEKEPSPVRESVQHLIEVSPYLSAEQATRINHWDTIGVVLNLADNFQSVRTTFPIGWSDLVGEQAGPSSPIFTYQNSQSFNGDVRWPDVSNYQSGVLPELNTNSVNQLIPLNAESYQLNENNEIENNRKDGEEAIDRAEDIALSIILDCLESIVREPPTSWHSCEDRSLASSSNYQSVLNPFELRRALHYTISHPWSSDSDSTNTQSVTIESSGDSSTDLEEFSRPRVHQKPFYFQSNNSPLHTRSPEVVEKPIGEEQREVPVMAANVLPVVMTPGQATDRPYATIPFPIFYGQPGADPDRHIKEFLTACNSNNARHESHWLAIFPGTL